MKNFVALALMAVWSAAIWGVIELVGFEMHSLWSSLGASVALLVGLIGNVWIYFLVMKETPWQWPRNKAEDQAPE